MEAEAIAQESEWAIEAKPDLKNQRSRPLAIQSRYEILLIAS
jgi:hypothetical protein